MIPTSRGEHDTLVVSLDGHDSGQLIRTVSFNRGLFGKAANSLHIEKVVGGADRGFEVELRRDVAARVRLRDTVKPTLLHPQSSRPHPSRFHAQPQNMCRTPTATRPPQ